MLRAYKYRIYPTDEQKVLFAKDIVRGGKNVIAINHFTPVEVNNAPTGWHQDLCCYLN